MAYSKSPLAFFGKSYSLASNAISLQTSTATGTTTPTSGTISCATADTLLFSSAHGLIVGDRVRFSLAGTSPVLPTGIAVNTDYYVKTVPTTTTVTISATRGGGTLAITAGGTTANTCQVMGLLDEVTDTEATATTAGDWRKVVFGIMEMLYWRYTSLAVEDRSSRLTVTRNSAIDDTTGVITRTYTTTIVTAPSAVEVIDE
jgi:hypothetical protein